MAYTKQSFTADEWYEAVDTAKKSHKQMGWIVCMCAKCARHDGFCTAKVWGPVFSDETILCPPCGFSRI